MINLKKWLGLEKYVSPLDQFLIDYDKKHPNLSKSQQNEINKHKKVFHKRDHITKQTDDKQSLIKKILG